jgi:hypothetical protein
VTQIAIDEIGYKPNNKDSYRDATGYIKGWLPGFDQAGGEELISDQADQEYAFRVSAQRCTHGRTSQSRMRLSVRVVMISMMVSVKLVIIRRLYPTLIPILSMQTVYHAFDRMGKRVDRDSPV